jgi:hypothetical protein
MTAPHGPGQAVLQLVLDAHGLGGLGVHGEGALPLETSLALAPRRPIDVAQMVIDHAALRFKLHRLFQPAHRARNIAQLIQSPTQAIGDIAVIGAKLHRAFQHASRFHQILPKLHPAIGQVIQY